MKNYVENKTIWIHRLLTFCSIQIRKYVQFIQGVSQMNEQVFIADAVHFGESKCNRFFTKSTTVYNIEIPDMPVGIINYLQ